MSDGEIKEYRFGNKAVVWEPGKCCHSGRCVRELPGVFNLKQHPWVNTEGATAIEVENQVKRCPSGALSIRDLD